MENNSFDAFNLDDYLLDVADFFNDYIINDEKDKGEYHVYKGIMRNSTQAVKIYKKLFNSDLIAKQRFLALITAFHQGIVLADNIFLGLENDQYYLYVVEPLFTSYKDKFIPLNQLLKLDLDYFKKHRLFQNLVIIVKSLHAIGAAHLEICPKNIWIEDQFLVYLRPFKIVAEDNNTLTNKKLKKMQKKASKDIMIMNDCKHWYVAPEQLFKEDSKSPFTDYDNDSDYSLNSDFTPGFSDFSSDMWSLGCVFAEMFVSLTPIFQAVDTYDRVFRYFEVLGIPSKEDIFYIGNDLYESILENLNSRSYNEEEFPLLKDLIKNISKNEAKVLTSLLLFNPNKRPRCEILLQFAFFKNYSNSTKKESASEAKYNRFSVESEDNKNLKNEIKYKENKHRRNFTEKFDLAKDQLSTLFPTQTDNQNDSSFKNMSNWWNIDPILTPKEPNIIKEFKFAQNSKDYSEWHRSNQAEKGSFTIDLRKKPLAPISNSDQLTTPVISTEREKDKIAEKKPPIFSHKSSKNLLKDKIPGSQISLSNHVTEYPSIKEPSRTASPMQNSGQKRNSQKENVYSGYINDSTEASNIKHEKFLHSKSQKDILAYSDAYTNSSEMHCISRVSIHIEILKNLKQQYYSHLQTCLSIMSHQGSFSCRIDFTNDPTMKESINLYSQFADIKDRTVKLNFLGEVDVNIEKFAKSFSKKPLRIYIFQKMNTQNTDISRKESFNVKVFGLSEIDISLILRNFEEIKNENPRFLNGWYHITDIDDNYRILGQMKVEVKIQSNSPTQRKQMNESQSSEPTIYPAFMGNDIYPSIRLQQFKNKSITELKPSIELLQTSLRHNSQLNNKNIVESVNIFDAIAKDLDTLNYQLRQKEILFEKATAPSKELPSVSFKILKFGLIYSYDDDFALTLQKLRQILIEDEIQEDQQSQRFSINDVSPNILLFSLSSYSY